MKQEDFGGYSDSEIIRYFRDASLRRADCGFNTNKANKISDHEMTPACQALAARGQDSLRALLVLTEDSNAHVQADAAIFAYDADPHRCRDVLKKLIGEHGRVGFAALVWLTHKDADFLNEFEELGRRGADRFLREMDRRYPRSAKN